MINEKVHLCTLDDSEIADATRAGSEPEADADPDVEIIEAPPSSSRKKTQPVVKAFQTPASSASTSHSAASTPRPGAQAQVFMTAVTASLDPSYRESCDEARFACRLAQDELQRLTQENRDLRTRNDLHTQSLQVQQQLTEMTRLQARLDTTTPLRRPKPSPTTIPHASPSLAQFSLHSRPPSSTSSLEALAVAASSAASHCYARDPRQHGL